MCALRSTQADLYLLSRTAGTRVTKLALYNLSSYARSIEKGKREIRGEGSASLILEAARGPPLLAHSRGVVVLPALHYSLSPLLPILLYTHVRVVYILFLSLRSVLSQIKIEKFRHITPKNVILNDLASYIILTIANLPLWKSYF